MKWQYFAQSPKPSGAASEEEEEEVCMYGRGRWNLNGSTAHLRE